MFHRGLVRFVGVVAAFAFGGLIFAPASAFACTPIDPQGPGQMDECPQSFTTPFPTANGQSVTDYAIEYIPAGAVNVTSTLQFSPSPSNATLSKQPFESSASPTSQNPDMTFPNPGPGEQAARQIWTWTANGASSPSSGTVTFTVSFEEQAMKYVVSLRATNLPAVVGQPVHFTLDVSNPNDDPVQGTMSGFNYIPPLGFSNPTNVHTTSEFSNCNYYAPVNCSLSLAAGGSASMGFDITYEKTGSFALYPYIRGNQISDGQSVDFLGSYGAGVTVQASGCQIGATSASILSPERLVPACATRAQAIKRCKKKFRHNREKLRKCRKKANTLPV